MRLLQKTTWLHLLFTTLIMAVAAVVLLMVLRWRVNEELDEQLLLKAKRQQEAIAKGTIPSDPFTNVAPTTAEWNELRYADTLIYDTLSGEQETYRQLDLNKEINGQRYHIWVASSRLEWEDFYDAIFWISLGAILLLLLASVFIQSAISRKIWAPFLNNLAKARRSSVKSSEPLEFEESSTQEFKELKETLENLISKARHDYQLLRTFSDNASHESQTPLAVILSKLDRLSQHPSLDENMASAIHDAREAANRLSKLNRSLLLLTKLENRQFPMNEKVPVTEIIQEQLSQMEELFISKSLSVQKTLTPEMELIGNRYLTVTLATNLLSNALRYAPEDTSVAVVLDEKKLEIINSGTPLPFDEEKLFNRFQKGDGSTKGTGLGLALASEICDISGWRLTHQFENGQHFFRVSFGL